MNELQVAYEIGKRLRVPERVDVEQVKKLSSWGFYVGAVSAPSYCPYTDAINGFNEWISVVTRSIDEVREFEEIWNDGECSTTVWAPQCGHLTTHKQPYIILNMKENTPRTPRTARIK